MGDGVVHRIRAGHVHSRGAKLIQGELTASQGEELQVARHGALFSPYNSPGNVQRSGDARGVFVDVEGGVEVGDTQALQLEHVVDFKGLAEVVHKQAAVEFGEGFYGNGLVFDSHAVDTQLELGKHGLPEEGPPDVVDLPVDDVGLHLFVPLVF